MGRDKARLPFGRATLVEHTASLVRQAAGNVTLIGPPERYRDLGLPVIPDAIAGCGPLGGLYTALSVTQSDWNILVACDMPGVTAEFLTLLLDAAELAGTDCLVPQNAGRLAPLCAVYHRRCLAAAERAIRHNLFKMHDFISTIETRIWAVANPQALQNVNTPEEWAGQIQTIR
jgi:molybdopterin-guanine dinucleotide biosynthesis protein A